MSGAEALRHIDQSKICYNGTSILQKYILCLQIFVNNSLVVEVSHAKGNLLCY